MSSVLPLLIQFLRENKFSKTEQVLFEELSELQRLQYENNAIDVPREDFFDHLESDVEQALSKSNNPQQCFDNIYDNEQKGEETDLEESYDEIDSNCYVIEQDSRIEVKNMMRDMIQTITIDTDTTQIGDLDFDKISDIALEDYDEEEKNEDDVHPTPQKRSLSAPIEVMRLDDLKHRELLMDLKKYAEELKKSKSLREEKDNEFIDEYEDDDDKGYIRVSVKATHDVYVQAESIEDYPDQQQDDDSEGYASSESEELNYSDVYSDSEHEDEEEAVESQISEEEGEDVQCILEEISSKLSVQNETSHGETDPSPQSTTETDKGEEKVNDSPNKEENLKRGDDNGTEDEYTDSDRLQEENAPLASSPYETLYLPIVYESNKTGFEESKDFPIMIDSVIAGRYLVQEYLGSAAFSRAIQCLDLVTKQLVCIKIIKNNKDFFDQSLDEIKLLRFINANGDPDKYHVVQLYDFFYHREHLFLVCELLRDNLYEFSKFNRENEEEFYFTIPRLQRISKQVLEGLAFIHSLGLIHCDLKPENILMRSYSRCLVKIIDFGSSCFLTDQLCSYVQSRTYRAPEVVLGLKYDQKVDVWSLGCILAELWTGRVLFANKSIQAMLARVIGMCGEFPQDMLTRGQFSPKFFTRNNRLYEKNRKTGKITFLIPKKTRLEARLRSDDPLFVDFVRQCLQIDPRKRPSVEQLLEHPWILCKDYPRVVPEELDDI